MALSEHQQEATAELNAARPSRAQILRSIGQGALAAGAGVAVCFLLVLGVLSLPGFPGQDRLVPLVASGMGFGVTWLSLSPRRVSLRAATVGSAKATGLAVLVLYLYLFLVSSTGSWLLPLHNPAAWWVQPAVVSLAGVVFWISLARSLHPPLSTLDATLSMGGFFVVYRVLVEFAALPIHYALIAAATIGWGGVAGDFMARKLPRGEDAGP